MTAPDPRVGEIQARLAAAADAPWEVADDPLSEGDWMVRQVDYAPDTPDDVASAIGHESTAEFIANAPADVAYLLGLLQERDEALARVLAACDRVIDNTDGHKPPGPPHPTREQATACRIRSAVAAANEEKE